MMRPERLNQGACFSQYLASSMTEDFALFRAGIATNL